MIIDDIPNFIEINGMKFDSRDVEECNPDPSAESISCILFVTVIIHS